MNAATALQSIARMLKPNVASLGYALFLAINAASVWGGVFPFLPVEFQKPDIVLWFFLSQSLVLSASYFASALGAYFFPGPTRRFLAPLAGAPYFLGWCCLIAAIYLDALALPLVIVGGALLGLGSTGFYMLWQRLFASRNPDQGNRDLILGTAWAPVIYFAFYLIPQAVTAYLIPLVFLPLFGLAIVLESRTVNRTQPMFEDVPREHPHVYRRIIRDYWRSALCVGALGFCTGIMRALAIGEVQVGTLVNVLSMGTSLVTAVALLALWQFKDLRVNVASAYRVFFPFAITSFLLLPFLSAEYERWLAAILYAVYSVAIMLMMIQCAQASRDHGINPIFIYGFFGGIVYALHDVGFAAGTFAEQITVIGMQPLAVVALTAVYLLGLMHFIGQGGFRTVLGRRRADVSIELVALRPADAEGAAGGTQAMSQEEDGERQVPRAEEAARKMPAAEAAACVQDAPCDQAEGPMRAHGGETAEEGGAPHAHGNETANEKDAPHANDPSERKPAEGAQAGFPQAMPREDEPAYQDRISKQAAILQRHYRLSAREAEVMELIARGNTVARIAEMLVVSENTIRTHSKRIYAKLDIHKKQELLDLIESFDPRGL